MGECIVEFTGVDVCRIDSLGVVQQGMESHGLSAAWYIITMGFAFVILTFLAPKFRALTAKPAWFTAISRASLEVLFI